jgi:hypothetical protein
MKISLNKALSVGEVERVGLGLLLLARMNYKNGGDWEKIIIDMLENINIYSKSVIK